MGVRWVCFKYVTVRVLFVLCVLCYVVLRVCCEYMLYVSYVLCL